VTVRVWPPTLIQTRHFPDGSLWGLTTATVTYGHIRHTSARLGLVEKCL
jgi:hypothetical protein